MENFIKNFHFVFRNPSLRKATFTLSKSFEILPGRPAFASLRNELEALQEIRYWGFPPYTEDVSPYVGNFWFAWNNWKQIFCERNFHQLNVAVSSATKQLEYCLANQTFYIVSPLKTDFFLRAPLPNNLEIVSKTIKSWVLREKKVTFDPIIWGLYGSFMHVIEFRCNRGVI